jgi:hypothetical protein
MKVLTKEFDLMAAQKVAGTWTTVLGSGWTQSAHYNYNFYNQTFIDCAGLSKDEETLFIKAATVQRGTYNYFLPAAAGDRMYIWDIMTSIPIDIAKQAIQDDITSRGLGMPGTTLNYEHVLYHRMQVFSYDLDMANGTALLADETQIGSLEPTASDRIYCYRLVSFSNEATPDTAAGMAPVRFVVEVDTKQEPQYEYLMRLKRSYDLQQAPDRD